MIRIGFRHAVLTHLLRAADCPCKPQRVLADVTLALEAHFLYTMLSLVVKMSLTTLKWCAIERCSCSVEIQVFGVVEAQHGHTASNRTENIAVFTVRFFTTFRDLKSSTQERNYGMICSLRISVPAIHRAYRGIEVFLNAWCDGLTILTA